MSAERVDRDPGALPSLAAYGALLEKLDAHETRLRARYGKHIVCREGCADCCSLGSLFAVEAYALFLFIRRPWRGGRTTPPRGRPAPERPGAPGRGTGAAARPGAAAGREAAGSCPLLIGGSCSVYPARPVICRTHGYPLLVEGKLDCCPKNFSALRRIESRFILDLDALDTALAGINIAFLGENGDPRFAHTRMGIGDLLETLRAKPRGTTTPGAPISREERRRGASRW